MRVKLPRCRCWESAQIINIFYHYYLPYWRHIQCRRECCPEECLCCHIELTSSMLVDWKKFSPYLSQLFLLPRAFKVSNFSGGKWHVSLYIYIVIVHTLANLKGYKSSFTVLIVTCRLTLVLGCGGYEVIQREEGREKICLG